MSFHLTPLFQAAAPFSTALVPSVPPRPCSPLEDKENEQPNQSARPRQKIAKSEKQRKLVLVNLGGLRTGTKPVRLKFGHLAISFETCEKIEAPQAWNQI